MFEFADPADERAMRYPDPEDIERCVNALIEAGRALAAALERFTSLAEKPRRTCASRIWETPRKIDRLDDGGEGPWTRFGRLRPFFSLRRSTLDGSVALPLKSRHDFHAIVAQLLEQTPGDALRDACLC